jgi:dihydroflavonol-4-reductase
VNNPDAGLLKFASNEMVNTMSAPIAVIGASGHIGNVVCRILIAKGERVKAFYNSDKRSLEGLPVEFVQGNVLNNQDLAQLIEGCDVVINCASIIGIHGDPTGIIFKTNTQGSLNVVEMCKSKGVKRMIYVSSVHAVMAQPLSLSFDETRPYKTSSAYAYDFSKARAEQIVLDEVNKSPMEIVVVRPSAVVGPFDFKPSKLGNALLDFYHQKIPVLPAGGYDFVDVRDVAQSLVAATGNGKNGEIYLLSGKYCTLKELAQVVHKVTGKKVPQFVLPFWIMKSLLPLVSLYGKITGAAPLFTAESIDALRSGHPHMDHSKATQQLGHQCRPIEDSVRDFYQWQSSNGSLHLEHGITNT